MSMYDDVATVVIKRTCPQTGNVTRATHRVAYLAPWRTLESEINNLCNLNGTEVESINGIPKYEQT